MIFPYTIIRKSGVIVSFFRNNECYFIYNIDLIYFYFLFDTFMILGACMYGN